MIFAIIEHFDTNKYFIYMHQNNVASLHLANGAVFKGKSFGYEASVKGEVIFNTAMTGYPEILTDPSSFGKIVVFTYPLIGNYGVPIEEVKQRISTFFESEKIHAFGVVISDYSFEYSHWNAVKSLSDWLKEHKIPAIYGVDTREITSILREEGSMDATLTVGEVASAEVMEKGCENPVELLSCKEVITHGESEKNLLLIDCGVKHDLIRTFLKYGVKITQVPFDYDFNSVNYDAIVISNGPGNPMDCQPTIENLKVALKQDKPILGIGLGHQLLCLADGASVLKLKYGHHGHNQPVRLVNGTRCFITDQNHEYAVDAETLNSNWTPLLVNMNDNTNEGVYHNTKPFVSVQFQPQTAEDGSDTTFLFDEFMRMI